jgi:hypothetical protein
MSSLAVVSVRVAIALVPTLFFLAGCTVSPGMPEVITIGMYREDPRAEEKVVRGVVNGLYEYDPTRMSAALEKQHPSLPANVRADLSARYVVRVGINRGYTPIVNMGRSADYVFLPLGWKSDRSEVSADPTIVNVGDVVEIRFQAHRYYNFLEAVVRKCDSAPTPDEKHEWSIGCKTYPAWGKNGYAGETYSFTTF